MKVALGGTFDPIHEGHGVLLAKAFEAAEEVLIGLASDAMIAGKEGKIAPFTERKQHLEGYLDRHGWTGYRIEEINQRFGPADRIEELDGIVVSPETEGTAHDLNEARRERGFHPLQIVVVPFLPAEDGLPVSSTRVRLGEIDASGKLLRAVRVGVGSTNPAKLEAVRRVLEGIFDQVDLHAREADSGVPPQPRGEEALRGAVNRATAALGEGDLGVGIEAGLLWQNGRGVYLDVQYCAVADRAGRVTLGTGPGFEHPPTVLEEVEGGKTVGEAFEALTGIEEIGHKEGAIGYLTDGRLTRSELTEAAVLMAMVPRIRRRMYLPGV